MAGSIQKRGENKYLLTVSSGFGMEGKRIRHTKTVTARSQRQAEKELAMFIAEVEKGNSLNDKTITLREYGKLWFDSNSARLSIKTLSDYQRLFKDIEAFIGHVTLLKLKPQNLNEFYKKLREQKIRNGKNLEEKMRRQ